MKGMKCRCGFATVSEKLSCPRCGKKMKPAQWADEGLVLSFTRLQAVPDGLSEAYNLALVAVPKGPKLVCWTAGTLRENDRVNITEQKGKYVCTPKIDLTFRMEGSQLD